MSFAYKCDQCSKLATFTDLAKSRPAGSSWKKPLWTHATFVLSPA